MILCFMACLRTFKKLYAHADVSGPCSTEHWWMCSAVQFIQRWDVLDMEALHCIHS